jgi:hypothetical protein
MIATQVSESCFQDFCVVAHIELSFDRRAKAAEPPKAKRRYAAHFDDAMDELDRAQSGGQVLGGGCFGRRGDL